MIGCSIKIDIRVVLLNFYIIKNNMENKNNRLFINTSFITAKKVVYTLFYRKNETVKNHVLNYQIIKNIKLTLKFRKI